MAVDGGPFASPKFVGIIFVVAVHELGLEAAVIFAIIIIIIMIKTNSTFLML